MTSNSGTASTENASHPLLHALLQLLGQRQDWTTWADLRIAARQTGHSITGWDRRSIASAAEASSGAILSCSDGYKLASKSTEHEILMAYHTTLRKALGSDRRARAIISFARRKGLLKDHDDAKLRADVERELDADLSSQSSSSALFHHPPDPPRPTPPPPEPDTDAQMALL